MASSLRIPPQVIGMGLLEAVPETEILNNADPDISMAMGYQEDLFGIPIRMESVT